MGEISTELKSFRDSVKPSIFTMSNTCTSIQNDIQKLSTAATAMRSSMNSCYNSENKNMVLASIDSVNDIYSKLSSSVSGELTGMISEASGVCSLVDQLDAINLEIAEQQRIINSNLGDTDAQKRRKNAALEAKSVKEAEFDTKHNEAKSKLAALKGKDGNLSFEGNTAGASSTNTTNFEYGRVEEIEFTSKDGIKLHSYVYIPKGAENSVTKLPVMLYMHGDSRNDGDTTQAIKQGLPKQIYSGNVAPQGIVIMPFLPGAGVSFDGEKNQQALIELTNEVVSKYNGDTNRISVAGHSHGGMTAYKLVNNNPGYFSCCVPISGTAAVGSEFKNVKVWSFNSVNEGNKSSGVTYNAGANAVNKINEMGGSATLTSLKKNHKYTNDETFEQKYISPDGLEEYVYEWMFRQTRA